MAYNKRKKLIKKIEQARNGRSLVSFMNFDRASEPPVSGISTGFSSDVKETLFRVLKESHPEKGIDLYLYTRGGDTNAVWPIVSIIREFDPDFQVVVPFRCHSSGTLVALGASRILMGPLSELSPIDPTTGNQFNPTEPGNPLSRMGISVEDVRAYKSFIIEQFQDTNNDNQMSFDHLAETHMSKFIEELTKRVHPLALGNVQRVLFQIQQLATNLLELHKGTRKNIPQIVEALTTRFYSHLHMINRYEAKDILGNRIQIATKRLSNTMDRLLRAYEDDFLLTQKFYLNNFLGDNAEADVRFIGGVVESAEMSYLFETRGKIRQYSDIPSNVQIQLPPEQPMPLVPGLSRITNLDVTKQGWMHNKEPVGVTT